MLSCMPRSDSFSKIKKRKTLARGVQGEVKRRKYTLIARTYTACDGCIIRSDVKRNSIPEDSMYKDTMVKVCLVGKRILYPTDAMTNQSTKAQPCARSRTDAGLLYTWTFERSPDDVRRTR